MGVFAILFAISSPQIFSIKERINITTTLNTLLSDFRQQQLKSMSGSSESQGSIPDMHGVYIESNGYVLFTGSTFNQNSNFNRRVEISAPLEFQSIHLPFSQIVFASRSGEIVNYDANNNSFSIANTVTNQIYSVEFNSLGVITQVSAL